MAGRNNRAPDCRRNMFAPAVHSTWRWNAHTDLRWAISRNGVFDTSVVFAQPKPICARPSPNGGAHRKSWALTIGRHLVGGKVYKDEWPETRYARNNSFGPRIAARNFGGCRKVCVGLSRGSGERGEAEKFGRQQIAVYGRARNRSEELVGNILLMPHSIDFQAHTHTHGQTQMFDSAG